MKTSGQSILEELGYVLIRCYGRVKRGHVERSDGGHILGHAEVVIQRPARWHEVAEYNRKYGTAFRPDEYVYVAVAE